MKGTFGEASSAAGVNGDETDNTAVRSGAVYVFARDVDTGVWSQEAYLKASNPNAEDFFGEAVFLDGDRLAVGASGEDSAATGVNGNDADDSLGGSGAAYLFARDVTTGAWSQEAYLKASNPGSSEWFGRSVSLDGDNLAVGARREHSAATGVNGDQTDKSANIAIGAVYLFARDSNSGAWAQEVYIKPSNTDVGDMQFGTSVFLEGRRLAVGAEGEDSAATGLNGDQADNSAVSSGAAYLFLRDDGGVWSQAAYVKASNTGAFDEFGGNVCLGGDYLAIGARLEGGSATGINGDQTNVDGFEAGAAYLFEFE